MGGRSPAANPFEEMRQLDQEGIAYTVDVTVDFTTGNELDYTDRGVAAVGDGWIALTGFAIGTRFHSAPVVRLPIGLITSVVIHELP